MKHVQPPPDGEVLPLDPTTIFFRPADDDPLPPHRSAAAIWLPLAVACTAAWTVAAETNTSNGCKERAREYLDAGELSNAAASMRSDLAKHPELKPNPHLFLLGTMRVLDGDLAAARAWLEDFR